MAVAPESYACQVSRSREQQATACAGEIHTDLADFFSASTAFEAALSSLGFRFSFFLPCGTSADAWLSMLLACTDVYVKWTKVNHNDFFSLGHELLVKQHCACSCLLFDQI